MQKCWKSEPEQRPTFSTLVSTLDNILQQNIVSVYLDLAGENYLSPGSDFGLESNKVTSPATFPAAQLPVTADDNQQNKPYNNLDGKVNQYKNLQSPDSNISSSLDLERDSLLEEKSKLIEESSCDEEVDKSQLEVEKDVPEESCLLLTPSQDKEMKDQEKIIGLGNSALTPHRYAKDPTASLHKTEGNPSRPRVHENPIYV
ncbi:hypothetical protein PoB_002885100 [Plakobranchus ocellatus]|uniref:Serine-threonine/tyrosine-protein kinase catalytic domain-containing protein n=1 Tax=Plakobranchus ocellatus TaxID=259542 RepID=A0AAV4A2F1_9GAST|nr:hypothetical protein PoB_002885100 [Plakobranchus ocellatus]